MRNGKAVLAAVVAAAGILATGCGQKSGNVETWSANENSIYVAEDMSVESALVYTSEQFNDLYDAEELSEFVRQAVAEYTAENPPEGGDGQAPVTLKSCSLEGRTGILVFDYASPEDFVKFAQATEDNTHTVTSLTVRKVSDELAAGGLTDASAYRTPKDKAADASEVMKQSDYGVVAVEGAATIFTEGEIAYVSGTADEVQLKGSHTAVTAEGKHYIIFK